MKGIADNVDDNKRESKGRRGIGDVNRKNFSKRAGIKGNLDVIEKFCPVCYHHKAFVKNCGTFCTRCAHQHRKR